MRLRERLAEQQKSHALPHVGNDLFVLVGNSKLVTVVGERSSIYSVLPAILLPRPVQLASHTYALYFLCLGRAPQGHSLPPFPAPSSISRVHWLRV